MAATHVIAGRAASVRHKGLLAVAAIIALPALTPIIAVALALLDPDIEIWRHLANYVLPEVVYNTAKLLVGVVVLTGAIGTALGWLIATCDFPGRRFFDWALLLPLAVPTYVLAFVAVGLLDFSGPLQSWLRDSFGSSAWVPPVRSTGGVIVIMSLALYPYVYLLARGAFATQGQRVLEAARTLGLNPRQAAWRVALPMARPWIAAGIALVAMETLADFGAVAVFNYNTFTTAIYRAWFGLFSVDAALELAGLLLILVCLALWLEKRSRHRVRYGTERPQAPTPRNNLSGPRGWLASVGAAAIFLLAFCLPFGQLVIWAVKHAPQDFGARYFGFVARSLVLASSSALIIITAAVLLAYATRLQSSRWTRVAARLGTLGYAVPGTVLAVGIFVPIALLNGWLSDGLRSLFGSDAPRLYLQGTVLTVLLAYLARFLAVGYGPVESGLQRITRNIDEAAISLGISGRRLLEKVHLPLLRTGMLTGAALVFVDVMKEMPITLITKPFGWTTLSVRVFEMTAEGEWERAALPAVAIVLAGLIPVALLTRRSLHVA